MGAERFFFGPVDPDGSRQLRGGWPPADETLRVGVIGGLQHLLTLSLNARCLPLVDGGRGQ